MTTAQKHRIVVVPEYTANELGAPFKVILVDSVKQLVDEKTGEVDQVIIPNLRGLLKCVAVTRILIPRKLSGSEIKFIRKAYKIPAKHVAEMIGVTPEHFSRCESNERVLSAGAEKCFRASTLLEHFKMIDKLDKMCEENYELNEKLSNLRKALNNIGEIINEMRISSAIDSAEADTLILKFQAVSCHDRDLFEDDLNADWLSNNQQYAKAA